MNVAILIPGFIKSYNHIDSIIELLKFSEGITFYVFGFCFDYMIKPHISKDKLKYQPRVGLDIEKINRLYTRIKFVNNNKYKPIDKQGFDSRIYSQWFNIKRSFHIAENYAKENNITYDVVVRLRSDLQVNKVKFHHYINKAFLYHKVYFSRAWSSITINDQLFIGDYNNMKKLLNLVDHYHQYHQTPKFKRLREEHKNNKNKPERCKNLRISCESETLLRHHLEKVLEKNRYKMIDKYWKILRV
jgi:hypothetical protein